MSGRRIVYRYILGIDGLGKLQSGYLQVHRQDAARRAATGSALAQIDIVFGMEVCVIGWVASRATESYY